MAGERHARRGRIEGRRRKSGRGAPARVYPTPRHSDGEGPHVDLLSDREAYEHARRVAWGGPERLARVEDMKHEVLKSPLGLELHSYDFEAGGVPISTNFVRTRPGEYTCTFHRTDPEIEAAGREFDRTGDVGHGAVDVFRSVGEAMHHFVATAKPRKVSFSAATSEPTRVRLYAKLVERLAKRYGGHALHQPLTGNVHYHVVFPEEN